MNLLVIDDVESSLVAVKKGLEKSGYSVDATPIFERQFKIGRNRET